MPPAMIRTARPATVLRLRSTLRALLLALGLGAAAALPASGMTLDLISFAPLVGSILLLVALAWFANRSASPGLVSAFDVSTTLLASLLPILVLSFATMRGAAPLADSFLLQADAALGIDALGVVRWADGHPWIAAALGLAYSSFSFQIALLPILLALSGQADRAYRFAIAFLLLATLASAISAFLPAVGSLAFSGMAPGTLTQLDDTYGYFFLPSFDAVRSEPHLLLTAERAAGILTFPSVHAGTAVLCGWAGWALRTRWGWSALNIAMTVSAITHGAHYVVDIIAGAALAAVVICLASRFAGNSEHAVADRLKPVGGMAGV